MTKGEHVQLKLKSKATKGVEKFGVPVNSPVDYEVTLINFEKVSASMRRMNGCDRCLSYSTDERIVVDERRRKTRTIRGSKEARRRTIQGKKTDKKSVKVVQGTTQRIYPAERRAHLVTDIGEDTSHTYLLRLTSTARAYMVHFLGWALSSGQ